MIGVNVTALTLLSRRCLHPDPSILQDPIYHVNYRSKFIAIWGKLGNFMDCCPRPQTRN